MNKVDSNKTIQQMKQEEVTVLLDKKKTFFMDLLQRTIIHMNRNKCFDIINISEVNTCIQNIHLIYEKIKVLSDKHTVESILNQLQMINNDVSTLLKNYGTLLLDDLLTVCLGNPPSLFSDEEKQKYDLLSKYFHPISYKVIKKPENKPSDNPNVIVIHHKDDNDENLVCSDISMTVKPFHLKVYGLKVLITNKQSQKSISVQGFVDDSIVQYINNPYIDNKLAQIIDKNILPNDTEYQKKSFQRYIESLSLKDLLIENVYGVYHKFNSYLNQNKSSQQKMLSSIIKDFTQFDLFLKRNMIIYYLIFSDNYENKYLAYLLYDLLSNDTNGTIDTQEQTILFDSFSWPLKQYFRDAMKKTITYTNELSHFDMEKIPLEQQICLMKTTDIVKEKAMIKLKEIKSKSDDSGTKARQYLEGLLKIPFQIYKKEPIFCIMDQVKQDFIQLCNKHKIYELYKQIPKKDNYTNIEIGVYLRLLNPEHVQSKKPTESDLNQIKEAWLKYDKEAMIAEIERVNAVLTSNTSNIKLPTGVQSIQPISYKKKKKSEIKQEINAFFDKVKTVDTAASLLFSSKISTNKDAIQVSITPSSAELKKDCLELSKQFDQINTYIQNIQPTLDKHVYGHVKAKRQIERILAQWINNDGRSFNEGYILGFEGNPGIGKTTLAKGLSQCLLDADGTARPFSIIAMGGSCNASTLVGHSYTYVGSSWGDIVQILIDKKCMNPIILIDEVDKISKTENGKEIIGILTHMLDSTQNNAFQDKYFSGIDIDLSKVLFVLSYNDVSLIDKVLLDRIHRIQFDSLSLDDKLVISKQYLLPELCSKTGLKDMIVFTDEALKFVIEENTMEPGVRKLKELLFDIVGEINLKYMKDLDSLVGKELPLTIGIDDLKHTYLKEKKPLRLQRVHEEDRVGVINCLWANIYNLGGILSASASFIPGRGFLELKLTGLLDKMMDESFQVSLTNAYSMLDEATKSAIQEKYNGSGVKYGIHLHMGDGSVEKSGTSAGIAITILFYSLLTGRKIKHDFAVTGEATNLNGNVGEIGALKTKITYGIKAGVKHFIYPRENQKDFELFLEKNDVGGDLLKDIHFYPVDHVKEALDLILCD